MDLKMEIDGNAPAPDWMIARHAIKLYLNDRPAESMELLDSRPKSIDVTSAFCFTTFFDAAVSFDSKKITKAIEELKKIEQNCYSDSGWLSMVKSKLFLSSQKPANLEAYIYERIVLADSLICQSFLNFLQTDLASCVKGGWTLRRAWKIYQETYDHLMVISKKLINEKNASNDTLLPPDGMVEDAKSSEDSSADPISKDAAKKLYSFPNRTVGDFSNLETASENEAPSYRPSTSAFLRSSISTENNLNESRDTLKKITKSAEMRKISKFASSDAPPDKRHVNGYVPIHKSTSLLTSLHEFGYSLIESTTSYLGFATAQHDIAPQLDLSTLSRLLSAVCFGYGVLRLMVSLAPSRFFRWASILGFKGDRNVAIKCLSFSRTGEDMRAPLSSITLLWYHTVVRPFFALDGLAVGSGVLEANKILIEDDEAYGQAALFLFFKGRMERLKPDVPAAICAYNLSVAHAAQNEMKILGLHEVGWCRLMRLEWSQAGDSFEELSRMSRWSQGFYCYLAAVCQGAQTGVSPDPKEILELLDDNPNKQQIEKYIKRRVLQFPSEDSSPLWAKYAPDTTPWSLYCFELLYLWNTLPSCDPSDLRQIIAICTPSNGLKCLKNEPMIGLSLLVRGAALLSLNDAIKLQLKTTSPSNSADGSGVENVQHDAERCAAEAIECFKSCIQLRSDRPFTEINKDSDASSYGDIHITAFAKYELGVMLLNCPTTRNEGKHMLTNISSEYKDYDFENRLHIRITATLKSVEKYEAKMKKEGPGSLTPSS